MRYPPLSEREEEIAFKIVDSAFAVHTTLGPGLLERVYEICFCHELAKRNLVYQRQVAVPIIYNEIKFDEGLRIDVFVEETVICEIKTVETILPVHRAQLLTYLKLTGIRLGFIINFNVSVIKNGIKRIIL